AQRSARWAAPPRRAWRRRRRSTPTAEARASSPAFRSKEPWSRPATRPTKNFTASRFIPRISSPAPSSRRPARRKCWACCRRIDRRRRAAAEPPCAAALFFIKPGDETALVELAHEGRIDQGVGVCLLGLGKLQRKNFQSAFDHLERRVWLLLQHRGRVAVSLFEHLVARAEQILFHDGEALGPVGLEHMDAVDQRP